MPVKKSKVLHFSPLNFFQAGFASQSGLHIFGSKLKRKEIKSIYDNLVARKLNTISEFIFIRDFWGKHAKRRTPPANIFSLFRLWKLIFYANRRGASDGEIFHKFDIRGYSDDAIGETEDVRRRFVIELVFPAWCKIRVNTVF